MNTTSNRIGRGSPDYDEIKQIVRAELRWFARVVFYCAILAIVVTVAVALVRFYPTHLFAMALGVVTGAAMVFFADSLRSAWWRLIKSL